MILLTYNTYISNTLLVQRIITTSFLPHGQTAVLSQKQRVPLLSS